MHFLFSYLPDTITSNDSIISFFIFLSSFCCKIRSRRAADFVFFFPALCIKIPHLRKNDREVRELILSYVRTVILYLILVAVIRIMGKRQIGEMEASEFVVTMLVANLAAIPMQDSAIPLFSGLVPILTVLGAELILSWLMLRSVIVRRLLCGKPVILIDNGVLLQDHLRQTRITLNELFGHLREKDILDISDVQYAILETDGNLSVFPFVKTMPASARDAGIQVKNQLLPITIIEDGHLFRDNLQKAKKDDAWLDKILAGHNTKLENTLLLTVDASDKIQWIEKEYSK